jgi:hypothetical protein
MLPHTDFESDLKDVQYRIRFTTVRLLFIGRRERFAFDFNGAVRDRRGKPPSCFALKRKSIHASA